MRRPLVCLLLTLAVLSLAAPEAARAQAAKAKAAPVIPHYDPPDQPFRMAPMPQSTRSIVVPLATNLHLAFDTALLRTHTVWSGRGLALLGPQYGLPKSPFISTNDGTVLWSMPPVFPWSAGKDPGADKGALAKSASFKGISTKGGEVNFIYELTVDGGLVRIHESFRLANSEPKTMIERRLVVSPCRQDLWLLLHAEPAQTLPVLSGKNATILREDSVVSVSLYDTVLSELVVKHEEVEFKAGLVTETSAEKGIQFQQVRERQGRIWLRVKGHLSEASIQFNTDVRKREREINSSTFRNPRVARMSFLTNNEPDPTAKPVVRATTSEIFRPSSASTSAFRSEAFPLPKAANLLVGGMDFLPNGDLALCTWAGEVWIVEGAQGAPAAAKYRRFARGLAEPMGLAVRDGKIYVGTKQALYRLTDTDGNGEADLFECLNQSWGYTGSYNAFVYGPVFDKAGNFILANAGHSGRWDAPYMGWGIRISPDGTKLDAICSGFREPNGIGTFGPDRDVFVSENQGAWMGACKLNHVTPGKFYGHPSAWPAKQQEYGKHTRFDPPAVWFPYKLARSTTGIIEITDDLFGPFKGQLMVGDFQNAIVTRVQLEKVNGEYQGAVWPFLKQFQSGVNRLAYGPDGKLYVGGCQAPVSWKAVAPLDFALERISYTGKLPFEVKEVHALRDGFELTFTQPVEAKAAADPESYDVTQYGLKYHAKYGSPEFDHDGKENATTAIKVGGATVSPDKLKVRLQLSGWKPGYVTMVRSLDVKNAGGDSLMNDTFWYTLNQLPK